MAAGQLVLTMEQGATFSRTLIFKDAAGVAINLTGQTFSGKIRKYISSTTAAATFTCTLSNQTTNPGELVISLTATETAAITLQAQNKSERTYEEFAYDLEKTTTATGVVERVLEGIVRISPEVTR